MQMKANGWGTSLFCPIIRQIIIYFTDDGVKLINKILYLVWKGQYRFGQYDNKEK